jgi:hypothetical protein
MKRFAKAVVALTDELAGNLEKALVIRQRIALRPTVFE